MNKDLEVSGKDDFMLALAMITTIANLSKSKTQVSSNKIEDLEWKKCCIKPSSENEGAIFKMSGTTYGVTETGSIIRLDKKISKKKAKILRRLNAGTNA
jgi:hypothetical protein